MRLLALMVVALMMVAPAPSCAQWVSWNDDFDRDEWDDGFFDDLSGAGDADYGYGYDDGGFVEPGGGHGRPVSGRPGRMVGQVSRDRTPWSGDWWRRKTCDLAFKNTGGGLSPFEKYDSVVLNFYGRVPGASAWEADPVNRHNDGPNGGPGWAGHCNGLAAAAILATEPRRAVNIPLERGVVAKLTWPNARACRAGLFRDGRFDYKFYRASSLNLTIDDMKGWLSEIYMQSRTQQVGYGGSILGRRYYGSTIDYNDPTYQDIYAHNFHYVLDTFIRQRRQAVVVEVDPHAPVNNHPAYRFDCDMQPGPGYTRCRTRVYYTDYAPHANFVGTNTMVRTYDYALIADGYGRVTQGRWLGSSVNRHPDFVWIPVGDAPAAGVMENPCINAGFVSWLLRRYGAYSGGGSWW